MHAAGHGAVEEQEIERKRSTLRPMEKSRVTTTVSRRRKKRRTRPAESDRDRM